MADAIRVGLLGCGIVGGATARILTNSASELERRAGVPIELRRIAVRNRSKPRQIEIPADLLTTDPYEVVRDPDVDVVVEVMGGVEPTRELILEAVSSGKHVVSANKELLATVGHEVMEAAYDAGVDLLFEAAVGGGIPIIRPMKESLAGDRVKRVMGIVNGTTNFILTKMSEDNLSFPEALAEAERLGYTEMDPTADIEGFDAAAKVAILASIAFNTRVVAGDVVREGITRVSPSDIRAAHDMGYEIKLLAIAESDDGEIGAHVHPVMLPKTHPLAAIRDVFNAVFVEGEEVGELMFFGRGAGGPPTASAVVGDIIEVARHITGGGRTLAWTWFQRRARIRPEDAAPIRYYVLLSVADQPGVLAAIASVFARHDVSIASVRQEGFGDQATLAIITHIGPQGAHAATFEDLRHLDVVKSVDSTMRVVGTSEG